MGQPWINLSWGQEIWGFFTSIEFKFLNCYFFKIRNYFEFISYWVHKVHKVHTNFEASENIFSSKSWLNLLLFNSSMVSMSLTGSWLLICCLTFLNHPEQVGQGYSAVVSLRPEKSTMILPSHAFDVITNKMSNYKFQCGIIVTSNFRNLPSDNSIAVLDTSGTKWFGMNKAADVQVFSILLHKKWNGLKETTCNISHGWMKYVNVSLRLEATLSGNTLSMGLLVTELMPCHCPRQAHEFSLHMLITSVSKISLILPGSSIFSVWMQQNSLYLSKFKEVHCYTK